jgi:solute carrier family 25 carnitine/acylcarnitine transporter 20/29
VDCVRQIWKAEGIRGIFRGLNITIAREIPAFGLYFASYEAMTRRKDATQPLGTFHMLMAGGAAGVVSWLFTYPIDFLKSRLQVLLYSQNMHIGHKDTICNSEGRW